MLIYFILLFIEVDFIFTKTEDLRDPPVVHYVLIRRICTSFRFNGLFASHELTTLQGVRTLGLMLSSQ